MAYDEELAHRLRALLAGERTVEKRMFGGLAFLVEGHMAVAVSGQGGLMVRVEPDELPALLAEPGASSFAMRGNELKGWLWVSADVLEDDDVLTAWLRRGVAFARSLPPKQPA